MRPQFVLHNSDRNWFDSIRVICAWQLDALFLVFASAVRREVGRDDAAVLLSSGKSSFLKLHFARYGM